MNLDMGGVEAVTGEALWSGIGTDTTLTLNNELNFNTNPEILNTGNLVVGTVTPNGTELQFDVVNPDPALVNVFSDPALDHSTQVNFSEFRFAENGPVLTPSEFNWHSSIELGLLQPGPILVQEALNWYDFYKPVETRDPAVYQAFLDFAHGSFGFSPAIVNSEVTEAIALHQAFRAFDIIQTSPELLNTFGIAPNLMHTGFSAETGPIVSYMDPDGHQHFLKPTGDDGRAILQLINGATALSIDEILANSLQRGYFDNVGHTEVAEISKYAFERSHGRQAGAPTAEDFRIGGVSIRDIHTPPVDPFANPGFSFVPGGQNHTLNLTYAIDPRTAATIATTVVNPDQLDGPVNVDAGRIQATLTHTQAVTTHAQETEETVTLFGTIGGEVRYHPSRVVPGTETRIPDQYEISGILTTGVVENPDGTTSITQRPVTLRGEDLPTTIAAYMTMAAGVNINTDEDTRVFFQGLADLAVVGGLNPDQRENLATLQDAGMTVLPGSEDAARDAGRYFASAAVSSAMLELGRVSPDGNLTLGVPLTDPSVHLRVQGLLNHAFGGNVQLGVNASLVNTPDGGLALTFNGNMGLVLNEGDLRLNFSAGTDGRTGSTNFGAGITIKF